MKPLQPESQIKFCDVVLLPCPEQSRLALQASQALSSQGSLFTLDNHNYYAHASLYMFQMDVEKQASCITALRQIAVRARAQQLAQEGYSYQDSGYYKGYIDIAFLRNAAVDSLQHEVINAFNNLRAGMREKDKAKMTEASGLKLENLKKYGYGSIGELFRPHITLTKFPTEIEPDLCVLPSAGLFNGKFDSIGLFEVGANGTCTRKIAKFSLNS